MATESANGVVTTSTVDVTKQVFDGESTQRTLKPLSAALKRLRIEVNLSGLTVGAHAHFSGVCRHVTGIENK